MIDLWNKDNAPLFNPEITDQPVPCVDPYIKEGAKACVVICPGGGYSMKATDHEGVQIAKWLNSIGISAFVLYYRVTPYKHPAPVLDGKRAIRFARYYAEKYGYDKNKIGILGFSAGGHLAGSVGTFKGDFGYELCDDIDKESSRPDFMILCYPVISFLNHPNIGSFRNLSETTDTKAAKELSVDYNVDKDTPAAFIWHTSGDGVVPVENSLAMANAMSRYNIPFEIHIYKDGPHGLGLAPEYKHTAAWIDSCKNWLEAMEIID